MNRLTATFAGTLFAASGAYTALTWWRISRIDFSTIKATNSIPDSLKLSGTLNAVVNPRNHIRRDSSRSITCKLPSRLTDEQVLARYLKGFFGSYVFGPEQVALRTLHHNFVGFSELSHVENPARLWSSSDLSGDHLPGLYTILFGAFQIVEKQIDTTSPGRLSRTHSYIDVAFGSDTSEFSGVHRFSIYRDADKDSDIVTVDHPDTCCNPTIDQPKFPDFMITLHRMYSMLLFREAVARVMEP
ncbi:hypothetical protein EJ04DRAFT_116998 [Polyplosphaeria fusca]|uniref:Uncharacterized protein n=1 Tax=Polyplosphaeria fusca TaxID=682080 RepID=A0A9P4V5Z3_9PLEO|nr:hypothetical protein EJ04DRAFT_116998 [Polyplosphaeria fusca]